MTSTRISFKQINQLAIPAIFSGIAESLITLTDIAMVGNVKEHSVEALAATGLVGSFLSGIIWIIAQTRTSISSLVSQSYGANKIEQIKHLVPQALYFNVFLSFLIFIPSYFFAQQLFELYQAKNLVLEFSVDYYKIRAFGYPLTLISLTLFGAFRGIQNTYWAMKCSLTAAIIHVFLDYILIFGIDGIIPAFHIKGAAYASLIAQLIMVIMAFYYYFTKTPFRLNPSSTIHPLFKKYLYLSFNFILRTASLNVAFFLANSYATGYGKSYIAAQSILMNIWLFFSFFIDGYAGAGNAMAGKLQGERNYKQLWLLSKDISKYSILICSILIAICFIFYDKIGQLFNQDPNVLTLFKSVFWIVLFMQPINTLAYIFDGFFKGMGDAKLLRNNLIFATFFGFLPTIFLADYFGLKIYGIWIAFGVWMLLRSFPLMYIFKKRIYSK
ncbi:putative efflux protein, MATE family [Chishuiella changwenlii]|uniref:Multidrug-efflux transporter n=1 Tax=Chishuiella changwenlii TaxID=1434701 RepID=A0A1M7BB03_9FLAO|nr:MATE family efflux transporter [Chishuiella changwenlii]GGE96347.1 MATE family efflux transporter [Chishuiella changwenlii]SHL52162.1 putative efflux protein, MATE family [Chishuiella changwenlii]